MEVHRRHLFQNLLCRVIFRCRAKSTASSGASSELRWPAILGPPILWNEGGDGMLRCRLLGRPLCSLPKDLEHAARGLGPGSSETGAIVAQGATEEVLVEVLLS